MDKLTIKTPEEIAIMAEGGRKIGAIKGQLRKAIVAGANALEIETLAVELIKKTGGEPSFMKVPRYHWATCINVNDGLVHGIPTSDVVFKKGDKVSVDIGLYYKGFHTDTSFSMDIDPNPELEKLLATGEATIKKAIAEVKIGNHIVDISRAIETNIEKGGYHVIRALVGHGVGRELHEEPAIPGFVTSRPGPEIKEGMVLAIEVMYTQGSPELVLENDGWTISVRDAKIAALYEETVAVTRHGPFVLTTG
jgi:methionyl aminopeptidase